MSGRTSTTRFRIRKASVPEARRHVETLLGEWDLGHLVERAMLIASELTTNAVLHAARGFGDHFELSLRHADGELLLEVADFCNWEHPELRKPGPDELGGRGLLLVDRLAENWGVRPRPGAGKAVWVLLPAQGGAQPGQG